MFQDFFANQISPLKDSLMQRNCRSRDGDERSRVFEQDEFKLDKHSGPPLASKNGSSHNFRSSKFIHGH